MKSITRAALLLGATLSSTIALSAHAQSVDEVIVLSSPTQKSANEVISTTELLTGDALQATLGRPIGDALSGLPGVDSAGYGPAVGQPVIRGLGGYRVDVMQNGMSIGDIAAAGGDHANGLSLFDAERVEVLKVPAALRYGAFAATGVVNSFNRHLNMASEEGTDVLVGFGDNADESLAAFFTRQGQFSLSGYMQDADNVTIPTHAKTVAEAGDHADDLQDKEQEAKNTESDSKGFSAAGHFGSDETSLSVMVSSQDRDYLVPHEHEHEEPAPGEPEEEEEEAGADIGFEQQSFHARVTLNGAIGPFSGFRADLSATSFEQSETVEEEHEGQAELVTTNFDQDSVHMRGEFSGSFNDWQALVGFEFRDIEFSAAAAHDEEYDEHGHGFYLPNTERTQYGLFAFAERERKGWLTEVAARFDSIEQDSFHAEHPDENASVSNDLTNLSAGLARKLDDSLLVGGSVSSTERAPSQVELFAEGRHHAVGRTELGETTLDKETSLSTELYIRKAWETGRLRVAIFTNDYSDFIYLKPNTTRVDAEAGINCTDDHAHCFDYAQQDAELSGFELVYQTGVMLGGRAFDTSLSYSAVSGELDDGSNLPLIPADKIGLGISTSISTVNLRLDVEHGAEQDDLGEDERKSDSFTKVDVSASWQPPQIDGLTLSASVRNLTDEEIRHHASPLKEKLPEAGQDIRITARYKF